MLHVLVDEHCGKRQVRMSKQPVGLTFQETMSGGFTIGASDPTAGHGEGARRGSTLTAHNTIEIEDLDRFARDRAYPAALRAVLDITALGTAIDAPTGTFHLFTPGDEPGVRLMIYRLRFVFGEQAYFLEGKKYIHDGASPRELWDQMRTLYTRLHAGDDNRGPVAGAGILSIESQQIFDLLASIQVTGPETGLGAHVRKAEAMARFGKMVASELWDAYQSPRRSQTSTR